MDYRRLGFVFFFLGLALLGGTLFSGCATHDYVLAPNAGAAVALAARIDDERIASELRGARPEGGARTWRQYWRERCHLLQDHINRPNDSEDGQLAQAILEHIRRRRAELRLPRYE